MTSVLAQIRGAATVEELEKLLPWNLTPERARACYAARNRGRGAKKRTDRRGSRTGAMHRLQRGRIMLMKSDVALEPAEIIRLYGLRFKIEFGFKQAAHAVSSFDYHFWMADMTPTRRGQKNTYLHRTTQQYREAVRRKLRTFHVYLFAGVVAQGLIYNLAACHADDRLISCALGDEPAWT